MGLFPCSAGEKAGDSAPTLAGLDMNAPPPSPPAGSMLWEVMELLGGGASVEDVTH